MNKVKTTSNRTIMQKTMMWTKIKYIFFFILYI